VYFKKLYINVITNNLMLLIFQKEKKRNMQDTNNPIVGAKSYIFLYLQKKIIPYNPAL